MKILNGDITEIKYGVLIHQGNNKGVMGAGVAKALKTKFPQHFKDYKASSLELGSLVCTRINPKLGVVAMISQDGYGRAKKKVYTNYDSFRECLNQIKDLHSKCENVEFYMPFNIGCGLANGDWNVISAMIEEVCPFITLIKLEDK